VHKRFGDRRPHPGIGILPMNDSPASTAGKSFLHLMGGMSGDPGAVGFLLL
jgi:hypothetical protein